MQRIHNATNRSFDSMRIYLSSTLKDLQDERRAVKEELTDFGVIESYTASEEALVPSVYAELDSCQIYIGVFGLRYGFIPAGETKSITHLEFERATSRNLKRFVFIKDKAAITIPNADQGTGECDPRFIEGLRKSLSDGGPDAPRPVPFSTIEELRRHVRRAISEESAARKGRPAALNAEPPAHPWEIKYLVSLVLTAGTDHEFEAMMRRAASSDKRMAVCRQDPDAVIDDVAALDDQARKSSCLVIVVTSPGLSRIREQPGYLAGVVSTLGIRVRLLGLLIDVTRESLPPELGAALPHVLETTFRQWSDAERAQTLVSFEQWCRGYLPASAEARRVGIPYMVVALNEAEAGAMHGGGDAFFASFAGEQPLTRQKEFAGLFKSVGRPDWPKGFYGASRGSWYPFGDPNESARDVVSTVVRSINNSQPGSRERRVLGPTRLSLLEYRFDEFRAGSGPSAEPRLPAALARAFRENVKRVCESGCLILLDEFSLLHPGLRQQVDDLLALPANMAVVSISAADPAHSPLRILLGEGSYLRVGNMYSQFRQAEDLRWELAINSVERLQRWLRVVLPELTVVLGQQQPVMATKVNELLSPASLGTS